MKTLISAVTWDQALRAGMSQADLAAEAATLGCQGVELRQYWRDIAAEVPVAAAMADNKLACTYACNEGLLADSRESTLGMLAAAGEDLAVAAALGAKVLRLNIAAGPFDKSFIITDWWRQAVAGLLQQAEHLGIPLAVENGPDPVKSDIALIAGLFGSFASPWLRLTFDTGNVDVRGLARRLIAGGYDGLLVLEFPGGDDPRGRVKSSLAYLAGNY